MKKIVKIGYVFLILFLILSTVTLVPATNKVEKETNQNICSINNNENDKFSLVNFINSRIKKTTTIQLEDYNFDSYKNYKNNFLSSNLITEIINSFSKVNPSILFNISIILIVFLIFVWTFSIGSIAVNCPQFLPVFVKYSEIIFAGVTSGFITDVTLILFQNVTPIVNQLIDNLIQNQNISSLLQNMTSTIDSIISIPGMRGAISAFNGVVTSLLFLKMWDVYQIIKIIGGGLFVSIPTISFVILYIVLIDILLEEQYA